MTVFKALGLIVGVAFVAFGVIAMYAALSTASEWDDWQEEHDQTGETLVYMCNGLKPDCSKTGCYYLGAGECRATTDERYAIRRNDEPVLDPSKKQ